MNTTRAIYKAKTDTKKKPQQIKAEEKPRKPPLAAAAGCVNNPHSHVFSVTCEDKIAQLRSRDD